MGNRGGVQREWEGGRERYVEAREEEEGRQGGGEGGKTGGGREGRRVVRGEEGRSMRRRMLDLTHVRGSGGKRCKVSQKRIGTSAFAVYPNNVVSRDAFPQPSLPILPFGLPGGRVVYALPEA